MDAKTAKCRNPTALLVVVCLAQFMVILDVSIVNVALPSIQRRAAASRPRPAVGRQRLHAHLRRLPDARRPRLRPARPAAGVPRRDRPVRRRSLICARRATPGRPARRAGAAGPRRGDHLARQPGDHRHVVRRGPRAKPRLGHVGRDGRARRQLRRAARWRAHPGGRLAGDLPHQRADRARGRHARGPRADPEGRATLERHFDPPARSLVTAGLTALVYGIVRTDALGWGSAGVLVPIAAGAVLLGRLRAGRGAVAKAPLMPLGSSASHCAPPTWWSCCSAPRCLRDVVLRLAVPAAGAGATARSRPASPSCR